MKKLPIFIVLSGSLLAGCSSNELTREEAFKQIKQEKNYSKVVDYDIYCGDPKYGRQVLDAGLETAGLVTVLKTQKLGDLSQPLVTFTPKAHPFLLPTPEKDKSSKIQRVKLADEELVEVSNIRTNKAHNKAVADYTTTFKNVTPFAILQMWILKGRKLTKPTSV